MQDEEILNIINKIDYLDMDYDLPYRPRKRRKSKNEKLDKNNPIEAEIIKHRRNKLKKMMQALNR